MSLIKKLFFIATHIALLCVLPLVSIGQENTLQFDGINDYVNLDVLAPHLSGSTHFTVEFWMKAQKNNQTNSIRTTLFAINQGSSSGNGLLLIVGGNFQQDGKFMVYDNDGGGNFSDFISNEEIADGKCHHIAYVRSNDLAEIYIDGNIEGSYISTITFSSTSRYSLGQEWDNTNSSAENPSQFYNGEIDNFRIWNRALTNQEVMFSYLKNPPLDTSKLIAFYDFNQGIAGQSNINQNQLLDKTSPSYNGTLNNFDLSGNSSNWITAECISCPEISIYDTILSCLGSTIYLPNNQPFVIDSTFYSESFLFNSELGCDSIINLTVFADSTYHSFVIDTICAGSNYPFSEDIEQPVWTDTSFSRKLTSIKGCDSSTTFNITVRDSYHYENQYNLCEGDFFYFPDGSSISPIKDTLIHRNYKTKLGCDSSFLYSLNIHHADSSVQFVNVCKGETFTFPDGNDSIITHDITYLSYLVTSFGCDSTITTHVETRPKYVSQSNRNICFGGEYTLMDGKQIIINQDTTIIEKHFTRYGCDSIVSVTLTVLSSFYTKHDYTICEGELFTFPNGSNSIIEHDTLHTYTLIRENGCDSTIQTKVNVTPLSYVSYQDSVCVGNEYRFHDGTTLQNIEKDTTRTRIFTGATGCDSIVTTELRVINRPISTLPSDTLKCTYENLILTQTPGLDYYRWSNGVEGEAEVSIHSPGMYTVISGNSCGQIIDSVLITEKNCDCMLFVPNAFTPNDNKPNEQFIPVFSCTPVDYHLYIFNRWGQIIFESKNHKQGWTGYLASEGIYPYLIIYKFNSVDIRKSTGHVNLLR